MGWSTARSERRPVDERSVDERSRPPAVAGATEAFRSTLKSRPRPCFRDARTMLGPGGDRVPRRASAARRGGLRFPPHGYSWSEDSAELRTKHGGMNERDGEAHRG